MSYQQLNNYHVVMDGVVLCYCVSCDPSDGSCDLVSVSWDGDTMSCDPIRWLSNVDSHPESPFCVSFSVGAILLRFCNTNNAQNPLYCFVYLRTDTK